MSSQTELMATVARLPGATADQLAREITVAPDDAVVSRVMKTLRTLETQGLVYSVATDETGPQWYTQHTGRFTDLRPLEGIDAKWAAQSFDELTLSERRLIAYAVRNYDLVNLPYAASCISKCRDMRDHTKHAIEVELHRAAR